MSDSEFYGLQVGFRDLPPHQVAILWKTLEDSINISLQEELESDLGFCYALADLELLTVKLQIYGASESSQTPEDALEGMEFYLTDLITRLSGKMLLEKPVKLIRMAEDAAFIKYIH